MTTKTKSGAPSHSRRDFIFNTAKMAGMALAGLPVIASAATSLAAGPSTPAQTEGPFYPVRDQQDKDADMTRLHGRSEIALGEMIDLKGFVVDAETGVPIVGAMVEFWQACATGKYNHPEDPNDAELDPNFQYWSQVTTGGFGQFRVKSIKPGAYPATATWMRPPHIHVKVHARGYPSLTTQLYFAGDALNDKDDILKRIPADKRHLVVVDFTKIPDGNGGEIMSGEWTIRFAKRSALTEPRVRHIHSTPELD